MFFFSFGGLKNYLNQVKILLSNEWCNFVHLYKMEMDNRNFFSHIKDDVDRASLWGLCFLLAISKQVVNSPWYILLWQDHHISCCILQLFSYIQYLLIMLPLARKMEQLIPVTVRISWKNPYESQLVNY